jgi:hypothetical protein
MVPAAPHPNNAHNVATYGNSHRWPDFTLSQHQVHHTVDWVLPSTFQASISLSISYLSIPWSVPWNTISYETLVVVIELINVFFSKREILTCYIKDLRKEGSYHAFNWNYQGEVYFEPRWNCMVSELACNTALYYTVEASTGRAGHQDFNLSRD